MAHLLVTFCQSSCPPLAFPCLSRPFFALLCLLSKSLHRESRINEYCSEYCVTEACHWSWFSTQIASKRIMSYALDRFMWILCFGLFMWFCVCFDLKLFVVKVVFSHASLGWQTLLCYGDLGTCRNPNFGPHFKNPYGFCGVRACSDFGGVGSL